MNSLMHFIKKANPPTFSTIIPIPKSLVSTALISFFFLAYIITDYWNIPDSSQTKLLIRDVTICLGVTWGLLASSAVKFEYKKTNIITFSALLIIILIINFRTLTSPIPWMGDEDHHIRMVLDLLSKAPYLSMLLIFAYWVLVLYLSWRKPRLAIIIGILLVLSVLSSYPDTSLFGSLRYPYLNYWPYALTVNFLSPFIKHPYHEILYRIIPFLSVVALTFLFQNSLSKEKGYLKLIWGVAVALIPTIYYYSSIFYLEMPAILLMTIVCLRIENLLSKDFVFLKQEFGWYALILIGFLKESTLPFLLCFLILRTVITIQKKLRNPRPKLASQEANYSDKPIRNHKWIMQEITIYFILLVPILYYLIFRTPYVHRSYQLTISNLLDPNIYPVIFRAFIEQFGVWILMFLTGSVLLIKKKRFSVTIFYWSLFLGYILFFALDQKRFIGYSRFLLFLLPPILAASSAMVKQVITKKKLINYALLVIILSTSIILSPIQKDGTKISYWGIYLVNTSEHYYPVDDAIFWMKENGASKSVLFSGLGYTYFKEFYYNKYDWVPTQSDLLIADVQNTDQINLEIALSKAEEDGYENVLFFIQGNEIPRTSQNTVYQQVEVFENLSHKIVLYSKNHFSR